MKRWVSRLVDRYGWWRLVQGGLVVLVGVLAGVLVVEVLVPVRLVVSDSGGYHEMIGGHGRPGVEKIEERMYEFEVLLRLMRANLFKSGTSVRDKPMADKTIERIKSTLKLQCLMEIGGESVAYINIKGTGLKRCGVGDLVNDLFTVVNINEGSVELSIVDHKVVLNL